MCQKTVAWDHQTKGYKLIYSAIYKSQYGTGRPTECPWPVTVRWSNCVAMNSVMTRVHGVWVRKRWNARYAVITGPRISSVEIIIPMSLDANVNEQKPADEHVRCRRWRRLGWRVSCNSQTSSQVADEKTDGNRPPSSVIEWLTKAVRLCLYIVFQRFEMSLANRREFEKVLDDLWRVCRTEMCVWVLTHIENSRPAVVWRHS